MMFGRKLEWKDTESKPLCFFLNISFSLLKLIKRKTLCGCPVCLNSWVCAAECVQKKTLKKVLGKNRILLSFVGKCVFSWVFKACFVYIFSVLKKDRKGVKIGVAQVFFD